MITTCVEMVPFQSYTNLPQARQQAYENCVAHLFSLKRPIMKVTRVSVTYDRRLNLGEYNWAGSTATLWADLEEGDDLSVALENLREIARASVRGELTEAWQKSRPKKQTPPETEVAPEMVAATS
jgi:hypothetical protein